jgi:thiosulfate/3-mercaptopyruvate sulfurtransferase
VEIGLEEIAERLGDPELTILDVRTEAEYSGAGGYPCDPRQGHVPGARNVEVEDLLERSPGEVRELVGLPEGAEIATYCHSGSRSAAAAEILRAAGYDARNYPGSWHEWSRREDLPAET